MERRQRTYDIADGDARGCRRETAAGGVLRDGPGEKLPDGRQQPDVGRRLCRRGCEREGRQLHLDARHRDLHRRFDGKELHGGPTGQRRGRRGRTVGCGHEHDIVRQQLPADEQSERHGDVRQERMERDAACIRRRQQQDIPVELRADHLHGRHAEGHPGSVHRQPGTRHCEHRGSVHAVDQRHHATHERLGHEPGELRADRLAALPVEPYDGDLLHKGLQRQFYAGVLPRVGSEGHHGQPCGAAVQVGRQGLDGRTGGHADGRQSQRMERDGHKPHEQRAGAVDERWHEGCQREPRGHMVDTRAHQRSAGHSRRGRPRP